MDHPATITVLSLCSGYAGLEIGLARALANPLRVVAVEVEAYALAVLEAQAAEGKLAIETLWPDLRTFPAERFRGCFDFVLAGFPCQPFSVAGLRRGTEDERHLWPHIERIINAVGPRWVMLENVPGLISTYTVEHRPKLQEYCRGSARRLGTTFAAGFMARLARYAGVSVLQYVLHRLEAMGYSCAAGLFSAAEFGAPHERERLFVLAHARRSELSGRQGQPRDDGPQLAPFAGGRDKWPAGPGQPQYEWEAPRTVVDAARIHGTGPGRNLRGRRGVRQAGEAVGQPQGNDEQWIGQPPKHRKRVKAGGSSGQEDTKVEPGLGRVPNESACTLDEAMMRVDRLRLLGNGCVPAQVELAFRTLYGRFV